MKPKILDLFSGGGGSAKGLQRAGFHVVGVDNKPQPKYCGDEFFQADALTFPLKGFDAFWASPPCHFYSTGTQHRKNQGIEYPDYIEAIRERLKGRAYIIENVPGAKKWLRSPILLCGSMFGLNLRRHRLFETPFFVMAPDHPACDIDADLVSVTRHGPPARWYRKNPGRSFNIKTWHDAMGIDWLPRGPLTQAIPPAYSEFMGKALMEVIQ